MTSLARNNQKTSLSITGMRCASCAGRIEKALLKVAGVKEAQVNFATGQATVTGSASRNALEAAVKALGYGVEKEQPVLLTPGRRLLLAAVLTAPVFVIAMLMLEFPYSCYVQLTLTTVVVFGAGSEFFTGALRLLRSLRANMDTLVAMGSGSAYVYSTLGLIGCGEQLYFETASMIVTLVLLGRYLEARARAQTTRAIEKLASLAPPTATCLRDGKEVVVRASELQLRDRVIIRPGDRIPADGTVIEGQTTINESMLTGESVPVEKGLGDQVQAGTINNNGNIVFEVDKLGEDTTLAHIVRLVREAQSSKAPAERLADRVAGIFVPFVLAIAGVTTAAWLYLGYPLPLALSASTAVLLVACPCALGLATPTAVTVGVGRAAEMGILIRNAQSLEDASRLDILIFDKTGTITRGQPSITDFYNISDMPEDEVLSIIASVERPSEHPFARPIVEYAVARNASIRAVTDFEAISGEGITASLNGLNVIIGGERMLRDKGIDMAAFNSKVTGMKKAGKSLVFAAVNGRIVSVFALQDIPKEKAGKAIEEIKALGIEPLMLTGDNEDTAREIAAKVGIQRFKAYMRPADKVAELRQEKDKGKRVGMVGDGINDAPVLAAADVSFAIGTGTDIAIETSQITLVKGDIKKAAEAVALSRRTMKIIKQNLFWAFSYNIVAIPLAAMGLMNPMIAAGCMAFSSVLVVFNSLRLKGYQPAFETADNASTRRSLKCCDQNKSNTNIYARR
ncbi:MAG: copper-translocating P-type ATPase [Planctomycetes bacterium RIFCSPHIGHO2_12_FULL_51_37]|nr:MAG: copper-translocating P-type ATPase [Planctomycetes bacterium RIFCSPHIGHO2_12_FULL_51_37]